MHKFSLLSPAGSLIALAGFFLIFMDINCNGTKLDSVTGIELVTGYEQDFDLTGTETKEAYIEKYDPNIFALNGFIAAILGLILFIVKRWRNNFQLAAVIGAIGFICMLGLMIDLKSKIAKAQEKDSILNFNLNIEFEMKFGYWLVTLCFLIVTIVNIMAAWKERKKVDEKNIETELI